MSSCDDFFDADFYDAMVHVERRGCARFTVEDLAPAIGIAPTSVNHFIRKGILEEPAYEVTPDNRDYPYWSPEQVARAMLARGLVR